MPLITQGKMNLKYIALVIIIGFLAGAGILGYYSWWVKQQSAKFAEFPAIKLPEKVIKDETANWKTYRNEKYGYQVKYPRDWRIAHSIMEWYKEEAGKIDIEDWVMFTNLSTEEEKEYLKELKRVSSECDISTMCGVGALNYVYNADGRSITIREISMTNKELEELKEPNPGVGVENFNFREEEIKNGLKIIRVRQKITWEMYRDTEIALIPYKDGPFRKKYIELMIERDKQGSFEKDIFEKVFSTFKFVKISEIVSEIVWAKYESPKMVFSIKYPSDWEVGKESPTLFQKLGGETVEVGMTGYMNSPKGDITIGFGEFGYYYYEQLVEGKMPAFQEIISEARKRALRDDPLMKEETIVIANKTAIEFTYNEKLPPPLAEEEFRLKHEIYIPQDEGKTFNITAHIDLRKKELYEQIFNQMLSTFRFLE